LGSPERCAKTVPATLEMPAHSAPLGLGFYTGTMFPEEYRGDLFVAFHGSWNRSVPTGYKVVRIPFSGGKPGPVLDFATGWLEGRSAWGRPVDVLVGADGALFVSDDGAGQIYRITYGR
ncbi:MAG: PQQ-dependent sugar dehydrogenase, partial [Candidatus Methylomirabilales bacterium]